MTRPTGVRWYQIPSLITRVTTYRRIDWDTGTLQSYRSDRGWSRFTFTVPEHYTGGEGAKRTTWANLESWERLAQSGRGPIRHCDDPTAPACQVWFGEVTGG